MSGSRHTRGYSRTRPIAQEHASMILCNGHPCHENIYIEHTLRHSQGPRKRPSCVARSCAGDDAPQRVAERSTCHVFGRLVCFCCVSLHTVQESKFHFIFYLKKYPTLTPLAFFLLILNYLNVSNMLPKNRDLNSTENRNQYQSRSLLLDLPSEVIHLICAQLCRHCCALTPLDTITPSRDEASPLKALSETCTALRDIAQPLFYHVPFIIKYAYFLRTIRERPDLADCVRCLPPLSIRVLGIRKDMKEHGFSLVKDMAAELHMITLQDVSFEEEFSYMLAQAAGNLNKDDERARDFAMTQRDVFYMLLHAILIASLPCLEILAIDNWYIEEDRWYYPVDLYHHAKRRLARVGRLVSNRCISTSMPSLHTIIIDRWRGADTLESRPDSYGSSVPLDPHKLLFSCASSLKQLVFHDCEATCTLPEASLWSALPALQSIIFDEIGWTCCEQGIQLTSLEPNEEISTPWLQIRHMVEQCANLSSFKISVKCSNGPQMTNSFSSRDLLQSLLPAASRLETLMIHMEAVRPRCKTAFIEVIAWHLRTSRMARRRRYKR